MRNEVASLYGARCEARVGVLKYKVEEAYGREIKAPVVKFTLRGLAAGKTVFNKGLIELNSAFFADNADDMVHHTLGHEYGHYAVYAVHGYVPHQHGREWQAMMKVFGLPIRITHDYDTTSIRLPYTWECDCTTHQVSRHQHRKLITGHAFDCVNCGGPVSKFKG